MYDDTAFTFHSGTGLVVQNHLNHVSVSEALLDKDNWLISKKTGEYAFAKLDDWNTAPLTPERELGDFRALHSRFVNILRQTNGRDYEDMLPPDLKDFLEKLIADDLKVQHIVCHSFFLPCLSKFLLRVLLDVKLKRPLLTADCQKRNDIKKMFVEMPYVDVEGNVLRKIVENNVFLRSWQKRIDEDKARWSLEEPEKTERAMGFDEEKAGWSFMEPEKMTLSIDQEGARWGLIEQQRTGRPLDPLDPRVQIASKLIAVLRAGCLHYHKPNLPKEFEGLLQGITIDKVIRMMNIEFPKFEQRTLELLAEHGLWDHLEIVKLFGKYAARLQEVIERDKVRPAEKAAKSAKACQ